jgi:hypothetical protein
MSQAFRFPLSTTYQKLLYEDDCSGKSEEYNAEKPLEHDVHSPTMSLPFLIASVCGLGGQVASSQLIPNLLLIIQAVFKLFGLSYCRMAQYISPYMLSSDRMLTIELAFLDLIGTFQVFHFSRMDSRTRQWCRCSAIDGSIK